MFYYFTFRQIIQSFHFYKLSASANVSSGQVREAHPDQLGRREPAEDRHLGADSAGGRVGEEHHGGARGGGEDLQRSLCSVGRSLQVRIIPS